MGASPHCKPVSSIHDNQRQLGTYPFSPEASAFIHSIEELLVLLASKPIQACNLEVTPEMAHVVRLALHGLRIDFLETVLPRVGLQNLLGQLVLLVFRLLFFLRRILEKHFPQPLRLEIVLALIGSGISEDIRDGLTELLDGNGEAVGFVGFDHLNEGITSTGKQVGNGKKRRRQILLGDITEVLDLRLQAPVPLVLEEEGMFVEKSRDG